MSDQRISVVGPCAAGKSTLVKHLRELGYGTRHCAQEHSYVPDMWRRVSRPRWLVYLDVEFSTITLRRLVMNFGPEHLAEQNRRLAHARKHCHLYIDTNNLTPDEVLQRVLAFLPVATSANLESGNLPRALPYSPDSSSSAASGEIV